jgi:hypothetical protein
MTASVFDSRDEVKVIGEHGEEGQEDMETSLTNFGTEGGTNENGSVLRLARDGRERIRRG